MALSLSLVALPLVSHHDAQIFYHWGDLGQVPSLNNYVATKCCYIHYSFDPVWRHHDYYHITGEGTEV